MIPKWAGRVLQAEDLNKITKRIAEVENATSGEVVPILVRRSYSSRSPVLLLALLLFILVVVTEPFWQPLLPWHWLRWAPLLGLALVVALTGILSRWSQLMRRLVFPDELARACDQRAELEFYRLRMSETAGRTGFLIFISLFEHRVVVLGDAAIKKVLPPETWDHLVKIFLEKVGGGEFSAGLLELISECGKLLAQHFPATGRNPNELHDRLIIKD